MAFIFLCLKLLGRFLFTNNMRYLQFIDVGFGIAVKLVIRLFVTVNCLTNDKAFDVLGIVIVLASRLFFNVNLLIDDDVMIFI